MPARRRRPAPRTSLDIAVHDLWRHQPEAILRLATGMPELSLRRVLPERVSSVRREADGVALANGPHGPFLAHVEFHADTSEARIARQMYVTGAALYARHDGRYPVLGTAVLLERRSRMSGTFKVGYGAETLVRQRFRVLRLYERPAGELACSVALAPLCALGAAPTLEDLALARQTIEAAALPGDTEASALAILYVVSGRRFEESALRALLWRSDMWDSSTGREIFEAGEARGEARGLIVGERRIFIRILERRFGPLPMRARAQVERADAEQIEAWTDRLDEVATLTALLGEDVLG